MTLDNVSDDSIRFQVDPSMSLRSITGDLLAMSGRIDFWSVSLAWPLQNGVTLKMGPFYVKNIHDIDEDQKRYVGYEEVFKNRPFMMARLRQNCLEQIAEIFEDQRVPRLEGEGEVPNGHAASVCVVSLPQTLEVCGHQCVWEAFVRS